MAVFAQPARPQIQAASRQGEACLWQGPSAVRFWHLASLDAPTVALVWSYAFAWAAQVRLPVWAPAALALIAWAVYIADRLLDARAGMQHPPLHLLRERHYFHWRHRWFLGPAALAASAAAAVIVMVRFPLSARLPDSAVALATLAYFSRVHSRGRRWPLVDHALACVSGRALLIGVLFTVGCLLPLASQVSPAALPSFAALLAIPAGCFVALAWLNCHAIELWESQGPPAPGFGIAAKAAMVGAGISALAALRVSTEPGVALLLAAGAVSALLFILLDRLRRRLSPVAVRAAADMVLLTPLLLCLAVR